MTNSKFGPHLATILKEMCNRVNADYNKINFKSHGWFTEKEWSEMEEQSFVLWMVKYLKKNPEAQAELISSTAKHTKDMLERVASSFTFNYGWKYKDEKKK